MALSAQKGCLSAFFLNQISGSVLLTRRGNCVLALLFFALMSSVLLFCQKTTSDPQALSFASRLIPGFTGGNAFSDVTLTDGVTWPGWAAPEVGAITAYPDRIGTGESGMNLSLHREPSDRVPLCNSTPMSKGMDLTERLVWAVHSENCVADAARFFPGAWFVAGWFAWRRRRLTVSGFVAASLVENKVETTVFSS